MTEHLPAPTDRHRAAAPEELRVDRDGLWLTITGAGARAGRIASGALRAGCRCAACRSLGLRGHPVLVDDRVGIAGIVALGGGAANIIFTDGHDRGVFPWDTLWAMADATAGGAPGTAAA